MTAAPRSPPGRVIGDIVFTPATERTACHYRQTITLRSPISSRADLKRAREFFEAATFPPPRASSTQPETDPKYATPSPAITGAIRLRQPKRIQGFASYQRPQSRDIIRHLAWSATRFSIHPELHRAYKALERPPLFLEEETASLRQRGRYDATAVSNLRPPTFRPGQPRIPSAASHRENPHRPRHPSHRFDFSS